MEVEDMREEMDQVMTRLMKDPKVRGLILEKIKER